MRHHCPLFLVTLAVSLFWSTWTDAYPMILEIPESSERCIRFTIPEDDDASVVFLALPGLAAEEDEENANWVEEQKQLEDHFILQMSEMQKYRIRTALPKKFPTAPDETVSKLMNNFLDQYDGEKRAGCKIVVSNPATSASRSLESFWFNPIVLNHIRKAVKGREDDDVPLEGFQFCFDNSNEETPIQMVVETVLTSDTSGYEDEDDQVPPVFESSNLTPLAEQLRESIDSANSVLNEMRYMEGRERRMRQTADSINSRVRYFSYISVAVLVVVTYVQVTYLKRYFRKKKLL